MSDYTALIPHLPAWLLVLFRITGLFILAPMFGSTTVPARVRILFALGLSFVVYPMLLDPGRASLQYVLPVVEQGPSMWQLGPIIGMELLIGFVIGYGASLPLMGLQVAGRVVDQQLGMGLAGIYNPELNEQAGVMGQFYFMLGLAIFILLGGHRALLMTMVKSFDHVPLGGFVVDGRLLYLVTGILGAMFELAVRVAAPLLCIIFLETLALGFIARTVPQMNILSIGFPLRILVGLFMIIGALAVDMAVYRETLRDVLAGIEQFFVRWDMTPGAGGG